MRKITLTALVPLLLAAPLAQARDYGQQGTVWPVVEPDLLAQIAGRLAFLDRTGAIARLNEDLKRRTIAKINRPTPVEGLGLASSTRSWTFDPAIAVNTDLKDDKGRLIVAAGTRVNPLDTVSLRAPLVFIDGDDGTQVDWALARFGGPAAKLILTSGAPLELMKARQHRFWFDQGGTLIRHFAIRALPATVEQKGRVLVVTEQALPRRRPTA